MNVKLQKNIVPENGDREFLLDRGTPPHHIYG
jgi:hypothetical protein